MKVSQFKSKNRNQWDIFTLSNIKDANVLRMILIAIIHITGTEGNITRKDREICYNKYRVRQCCGNIGITNCTTVDSDNKFTQILSDSLKCIIKWYTTLFLQIISNYYIWTNISFEKNMTFATKNIVN